MKTTTAQNRIARAKKTLVGRLLCRLCGDENQTGNSTPSDISIKLSYGGSNLMSRNFNTSSVNFSTSRMENS